jgi:hypothetical protein
MTLLTLAMEGGSPSEEGENAIILARAERVKRATAR